MNKPMGFSGQITPQSACENIQEDFTVNGIAISVDKCVFKVGYDNPSQEQEARQVTQNLLNSWRLRNHIKIDVNFNTSWEPAPTGGKHYNVSLSDKITVTDRVTIVTTQIIKGMSYIVKPASDSYSFKNDINNTAKALGNKTLQDALTYFGEEVVDHERPLYGIYKALEVITDSLQGDGRDKLAKLAGKKRKYVSDVMETANYNRHGNPQGRNLLTASECKERAQILINAYAASV